MHLIKYIYIIDTKVTPPHFPPSFPGWSQFYVYTADLLCLSFHLPLRPEVQRGLASVHTPLKAATWSQVLAAHPDKAFACYLLAGITEGFRIGFRYGSSLTSSSANMASAIQHPEVFEEYLSKELSLGHMLVSSMNLLYL